MKRVLLILLVIGLLIPVPTYASTMRTTKQAETQIKRRYNPTRIFTHSKRNDEAFWKVCMSRKGKKYYLVSKISGVVVNNRKDGKDATGYYISYRYVRGVRKGSRVVTYLVYSRVNNEPDDIIARYDVVTKR